MDEVRAVVLVVKRLEVRVGKRVRVELVSLGIGLRCEPERSCGGIVAMVLLQHPHLLP